jgi:hypothetical protein
MTEPSPRPPELPEPASSQAMTALVVGVLGLLSCFWILSPIAWYLGSQECQAIREERSPASGARLARAAVVLGRVGTALLAGFVVWLLFLGGLARLSELAASWR